MLMPIPAKSALDRTDAKRRTRETILVVDNRPSIREAMAVILGRAGYSVLLAANPYEAASTFSKHFTRIDLIITDQWMPGVNGFHLVGKPLPIRPRLKFILTSANARPAVDRDVLVLKKPFSLYELLSGVIRALREG